MTLTEIIERGRSALISPEIVRAALDAETDIGKVRDFSKACEAARRFCQSKTEEQNHAADCAIYSDRRLGQLLKQAKEEGLLHKGGQPKKERGHDAPVLLTEIGITPDQSKRSQKLAAIPDKDVEAYREAVTDDRSKAGLLRFVSSGGNRTQSYSGETEWYTPTEFIESARSVMGGIDVDPASNVMAQKVVKASTFHTIDDSGLEHEWNGNVFLNPPYKQPACQDFVNKLCDEYQSKQAKQAILLTNNCTDTQWWHRAATVASRICFVFGRIKFYNQAGEGNSPTNGQTFFYFGRRPVAFANEFEKWGLVK